MFVVCVCVCVCVCTTHLTGDPILHKVLQQFVVMVGEEVLNNG